MKQILAHLIGVLAFCGLGIAGAVAYRVIVGGLLGLGGGGFGLAAIMVVMPVGAAMFGGLVWLPTWLVWRRLRGQVGLLEAALSSAVLAFILSMVLIGPAGFALRGGASLLNFFSIALAAAGAASHAAILRRWMRSEIPRTSAA